MIARRISVFVGLLLLAALPAEARKTIDFGRYHALVIGINDYVHLGNLTTAVADA